MPTRRHMRVDIQGALNNWSNTRMIGVWRDDKGGHYSPHDAKFRLLMARDKGYKFLPVGDCEGFDYQTGCPGHEIAPPNQGEDRTMSDAITIPFPETRIIAAVEEHLNKDFFKHPHKIIGVVAGKDEASFIVTAEPLKVDPKEPKVKKPRKTYESKRGLKEPVIEQQVNGGVAAEA